MTDIYSSLTGGAQKDILAARRELKSLQWQLAQLKWWQFIRIVRMWQRIWSAEDELERLIQEERNLWR